MTEYIEREKVLALQTDLHFDNIEQLKHWKCRHIDPTDVQLLPVADVRPVVLCRDCMLRQYCRVAQYLGADGFCSNGKKRKES